MRFNNVVTFLSAALSLLWLVCCQKPEQPVDPVDPVKPDPSPVDTTPVAPQYEVVKVSDVRDTVRRADVTYQLLVYSFADSDGDGWGDFGGITAKMDYIRDLGASAIWLSPVHPSGSYHGYDVEDYSSVNTKYGTVEDFRKMVSAAHQRGIKVYLDYVLNHCGSNHPWFRSAAADSTSPYRDFFIFSYDPKTDIKEGAVPMISTEGASGYDSGQWFSTTSGVGASGLMLFTLDWSDAAHPCVKVERTEGNPDADNSTTYSGEKFLYYGDGVCKRFYYKGDGLYQLTVDFASDWGFLIRTSGSSWASGTKYGASSNGDIISFGSYFPLKVSTSSFDPCNIQFSRPLMYHSHFWTSSFADLNYGDVSTCSESPAFKAVVKSACDWIDEGVDGFRLDAVKHIYHNEHSDENPRFLKEFHDAVNSYYRLSHSGDIYMVGEVFSEHDAVAPYCIGLPALFDFSFWWRLKDVLGGGMKPILFPGTIISYKNEYSAVRSGFLDALKLSNHDENRTMSDLGGSLPKARMAASVLLTCSGTPYIYYGEELGMTGKKDKGDIYVRQPMPWGDSYVTSFTDEIAVQSAADVVTQSADSGSLLSLYRELSSVRNAHPALASGVMSAHPLLNPASGDLLYPNVAAWYMTAPAPQGGSSSSSGEAGERLLVIHNIGSSTTIVPLEDSLKNSIFVNGEVHLKVDGEKSFLKMGGWSSVVFVL